MESETYLKSEENPKVLEVSVSEPKKQVYNRKELEQTINNLTERLKKLQAIKSKMDELGVE